MAKQSVISQLATLSEEALAKLASSDFAKDAISERPAGQGPGRAAREVVAELDDRLDALEKRVGALEPKKATPAKKTSTAAAKKPASTAAAEADVRRAQAADDDRQAVAPPSSPCHNGWRLDAAAAAREDHPRHAVRLRGCGRCRALVAIYTRTERVR